MEYPLFYMISICGLHTARYLSTYIYNTFKVAVCFIDLINKVLELWDGFNHATIFQKYQATRSVAKTWLDEVSPSRHSFNSLDPVLARSSRSDDLIWWICVSWGWRVFWELMAFQMRTKARWRVPGYQWAAGLCGNFKQWCGSLFSLRALHSLMTWGM